MTFTTAYTPLNTLDIETGEHLDRPPRILDPDAFDAIPDGMELANEAFTRSSVLDEDPSSKTNGTPDTVLKGFKTWTPALLFHLDHDPSKKHITKIIHNHLDRDSAPLGYVYNLERLGIEYEGMNGQWQTLFKRVSETTEPFSFYQSPREYHFPNVTEFHNGTESVYYVECVAGELYIEEQTFERTGRTIHTTNTTKHASHTFTKDTPTTYFAHGPTSRR